MSHSRYSAFRRVSCLGLSGLLCSGCTLEIRQPQGGFGDQCYDFSCELASLSLIRAQSVLLGLDAFLLFVYSTRNFITVPLGMNWLQFLCMLGTESRIIFQALGNLSLTLQNVVCWFIYVCIYVFIYLSWQILSSIYTKEVGVGFCSSEDAATKKGWFESSRVIWGVCVVGVSYCLRTFFELAPHADRIDIVSIWKGATLSTGVRLHSVGGGGVIGLLLGWCHPI